MLIYTYSIFLFILCPWCPDAADLVRRDCTAQCSFQMNFGDSIQRPGLCSERIVSYTCVTRLTILYSTQEIFIDFRTSEFENEENEIALYTIQQVSHLFEQNYSSYVILFGCSFADNCDWIYTYEIIDRFTRINYTSMFNQLRSVLYDNSDTSVSQCFSENNIVDCKHGRCSSVLTEGNSQINRSCLYSSNVSIGIDIRRYREFPQVWNEKQNYLFYLCNRQLCNDPNTENLVRTVIQSYASILDIPQPSKSVMMRNCAAYYSIIFIRFALKNSDLN